MDAFADNSEIPNSDAQPNKRRRKKSIVWDHFTVKTINADNSRAFCNDCKKSFAYITGSRFSGTSHLKRHISKGICPVSRLREEENNSMSPRTPASKKDVSANVADRARRRYRADPGYVSIIFNQERCNHDIAKMIIQHDYPLHMVEDSGFNDFVRTLQPQFSSVNVTTIEECIESIYLKEKHSLSNLLGQISGRFSLTMDFWASDESSGYVFLTGHFIDCDWKLHRRVLNITMVPNTDSEDAFSHAVSACLKDWGFENRLFTLNLDHSFANDSVKQNLRGLLSIKHLSVLNGQLILSGCYARVLSNLALDAMELCGVTIGKVRESVLYVKTSGAREEKFLQLKQQLQVPSAKGLIIDDLTKWDTTYHMLMAASELKEVFSCLDTSDPDYRVTLSMEEWGEVDALCGYLKLFFDAANIIVGPVYPTTDTFFHEVWKIQLELLNGTLSVDPLIRNLTKPLLEKFDCYWRDCNLILATAVVMDPRFKMKLVEFSFNRIYGANAEPWIKIVDEGVHELFLEYVVQALPAPTFGDLNEADGSTDMVDSLPPPSFDDLPEGDGRTDMTQDDGFLYTGEGLSDFDVYISGFMSNVHMKSELDDYLEESLLPRVQDFDVLGWWSVNKFKYPTLSKMASDILCIPVSTVASDSVFDTGNRKMSSRLSSLRPQILEALLCAKDWLWNGSPQPLSGIPTGIVKMEY